MPEQIHRIVSAEESDVHDEPHLEGHRITVRQIAERVEHALAGFVGDANLYETHGDIRRLTVG